MLMRYGDMTRHVLVGGRYPRGCSFQTQSRLECIVEPGVGRDMAVLVQEPLLGSDSVNASSFTAPSYLSAGPEIRSSMLEDPWVSVGSVSHSAPAVSRVDVQWSGGESSSRLRIEGLHFGPNRTSSEVTAMLDGEQCLPLTWESDSLLTCQTPALLGRIVPLVVSVGGQSSAGYPVQLPTPTVGEV